MRRHVSCLALLRVGFTRRSVTEPPVRSYRTFSPLPETFRSIGGMFSVALSVPYGPTNYEAHCPVELGLSSLDRSPKRSPVCLRRNRILQVALSHWRFTKRNRGQTGRSPFFKKTVNDRSGLDLSCVTGIRGSWCLTPISDALQQTAQVVRQWRLKRASLLRCADE